MASPVFSGEFKLEAVKLIRKRGITAAQTSRDLGIHQNVLRKQARDLGSDPAHAFLGKGQIKPEQSDLERLRHENVKLRAERAVSVRRPLRGRTRKSA